MAEQSATEYLTSEVNRLLHSAKAIAEKAQEEGRALSSEEKGEIKAMTDKVEEHRKELRDREETAQINQKLDDISEPFTKAAPASPQYQTPGERFVSSEGFKAFRQSNTPGSSGLVDLGGEGKALITSTASPIVQPDVRPGLLPILFQRLTVADLMPSGQTDSTTVRYLQEDTATNAATSVAEGATKPESTWIGEVVDEPVRKIATVFTVTDEMLDDVAQLRSYLDARLRFFVEQEEEDQLLNGDGTAPNISGILDRTGIQTQALGADNRPDAIYKAIGLIRKNAFLEPDGIVIHPDDWEQVRLLKDGNQQYYGGGPFTAAYGNAGGMAPDMLWGKRVVVTAAIAAGTALVGAFQSSAQIFRKSGISVEASNSHSTFFVENKVALRAEERLALAVYRPAGFATVTGI